MFSNIAKFQAANVRRPARMPARLSLSNDNSKAGGGSVRPRQSGRPSLACHWRPMAGGGLACHWDAELSGDAAAGEPDQRRIGICRVPSFAQAA
jgi:hypothetical protein